VYALKAKKFEFLVHLDAFSKYLRNFLKNSLNEPKNSDFFASQLSLIILSQVGLFSYQN
jgi:hypothetical protein